MATISRYPLLHHLRSAPNQFILHYSGGRIVNKGAGISFWFSPLSAALAQLPTEDCETTFVLNERTGDFQDVSVQCSVTFRVVEHEVAATRINFSISSVAGTWTEQPLERLATAMSQRAQDPARAYLSAASLQQAVQQGAAALQQKLSDELKADNFFHSIGVAILAVQVVRVAPTPEMERALQTPTREALQQKADQATFERRALAVEKERAIKENELATEIELARRQEDLIGRKGANKLLEVRQEADAEMARARARAEQAMVEAESASAAARARAGGEAEARKLMLAAETEAEAARIAHYSGAPAPVVLGLSLQEFARRVKAVRNINITPEMLGTVLEEFLGGKRGG